MGIHQTDVYDSREWLRTALSHNAFAALVLSEILAVDSGRLADGTGVWADRAFAAFAGEIDLPDGIVGSLEESDEN